MGKMWRTNSNLKKILQTQNGLNNIKSNTIPAKGSEEEKNKIQGEKLQEGNTQEKPGT